MYFAILFLGLLLAVARCALSGEFSLYASTVGLMSYGASLDDMTQRVASYTDRIFKGAKTRRLAGGAGQHVRSGDQSENSAGPRHHDSAIGTAAGG